MYFLCFSVRAPFSPSFANPLPSSILGYPRVSPKPTILSASTPPPFEMKVILVGANGFVGSAFKRLLPALGHELIPVTRENYEAMAGTAADVVIEAAGNSRKFFAEEQ